MDLTKTHYLGPRAFFLFLGRRLKWPLLFLLVVAAAWRWRNLVPPEYQIWSEYGVKLLFFSWCALIAFVVMRSFIEYRSHSFRFEDEYFQVVRGYFFKDETGVVYHQIQHVSLKSGVLDRMIGVRNLVIVMNSAAGEANKNVIILPALDRTKAAQIQRELLRKAHHSGRRAPQQLVVDETEEYDDEAPAGESGEDSW